MLGGGLEPDFRVLVSTLFHPVAQENRHRGGNQWNLAEAKLLQTVASLRTLFLCVSFKGRSAGLGYFCALQQAFQGTRFPLLYMTRIFVLC